MAQNLKLFTSNNNKHPSRGRRRISEFCSIFPPRGKNDEFLRRVSPRRDRGWNNLPCLAEVDTAFSLLSRFYTHSAHSVFFPLSSPPPAPLVIGELLLDASTRLASSYTSLGYRNRRELSLEERKRDFVSQPLIRKYLAFFSIIFLEFPCKWSWKLGEEIVEMS